MKTAIDQLTMNSPYKEPQRDRTKRGFLDEWVRAVNQHGEFGAWKWTVSKNPADVAGIIESVAASSIL